MLAFVKGTVDSIFIDRVCIDVSGVGYELLTDSKTLSNLSLGQIVKLHTYLNVTQEGIYLYGFETQEAKSIFLNLISVSKVGPKLARSCLGTFDPPELATAIATANVAMLSKVPGMGLKTAQRVVLELKEKIAHYEFKIQGTTGSMGNQAEAITALMALGYNQAAANSAVSGASGANVEEIIMAALKLLAK